MTDQNFRWIVVVLLVANTFLVCALAGAGFVYLRNDTAASAARMPLAGEQLPKAEREAFRQMLSDARNHLFDAPHMVIFPSLALVMTVLSFNFLGDALRDWLDPRNL